MAAERKAIVDARLRWKHGSYRIAPGPSTTVRALWTRPSRRRPSKTQLALRVGAHVNPFGAHSVRNTKVGSSVPLMPYHHVELGLWGPFEVGDPQGFQYLFGGVEQATGKVLLQPIRAKSEAKEPLCAYLALIREQCPGITKPQLPLWFKDMKVPVLSVVSSDRGG